MRGFGRWTVVAACAFAAAGCTTLRHNDVLIFGTDTKLAVDVSAAPTSGGAPEITIGYKRQEAVWMPLVVNGNSINKRLIGCRPPGEDGAPPPASVPGPLVGPAHPAPPTATSA